MTQQHIVQGKGTVAMRPLTSRSLASLAIATSVLALALGGCARRSEQNVDITAQIPDVYQERHPIVLGDVAKDLDVFLAGNAGLDYRQAEDVKEFVSNYKKQGKGALVAVLPTGAPPGSVSQTMNEIRKIAQTAGIGGGHIRISHGPTHPTAASIRLQYSQMEAKVVGKCGQWPYDPAGSTTLQSWTNKPYYNLGCSYQSMLAAQVADPRDLVRSRPEGPVDVAKRMSDIEDIRENKDPTTKWPDDKVGINQALK